MQMSRKYKDLEDFEVVKNQESWQTNTKQESPWPEVENSEKIWSKIYIHPASVDEV